MNAEKLARLKATKQCSRAAGMRVKGIRRPSTAVSNKGIEDVIRSFKPVQLSMSGITLYSHTRELQLQFNSPQVVNLPKAKCLFIQGVATQTPEEETVFQDDNQSKERPQNRFEKRLKNQMRKKTTINLMSPIPLVKLGIRDQTYKIQLPEVYRIGNKDSYLIFGIIEQASDTVINEQDLRTMMMNNAQNNSDSDEDAPNLVEMGNEDSDEDEDTLVASVSDATPSDTTTTPATTKATPVTTTSDTTTPGTTENSEGEIELVMQQAEVSREEAISALNLNEGDVVEAIVSLT